MAQTSGSDEMGSSSPLPSARQHPLLLWFDLLDTAEYKGPLFRYWLSLGAYYFLLFACAWYVLQWFRRGRPWARARSSVAGGHKKGDVGGGAIENNKNTAPPALLYKETARNRRLLSKTTVLRQPYIPSPWLGHRLGGHMQSFMFATWCPPNERMAVSRLVSREDRVVSSFDGGAFRMDWFDLTGTGLPADAPVVFVLPGVVGQGTNVYVRHLAAHLSIKYGWRVVAKSWRGIGSRLSSRRPETWDHAALSDARDAIRHVRAAVGQSVPMLGVGFSFGGCLLTAIAGSVPQEEHGLCGLVSISGLFDMAAMMRHIAEQYAYPYGFANTKVTVNNYRKFKVLETLTAEEVAVGASGGGGDGGSGLSGASSCTCEVECVTLESRKTCATAGRSSADGSTSTSGDASGAGGSGGSSSDDGDDMTGGLSGNGAVMMMMAPVAEGEEELEGSLDCVGGCGTNSSVGSRRGSRSVSGSASGDEGSDLSSPSEAAAAAVRDGRKRLAPATETATALAPGSASVLAPPAGGFLPAEAEGDGEMTAEAAATAAAGPKVETEAGVEAAGAKAAEAPTTARDGGESEETAATAAAAGSLSPPSGRSRFVTAREMAAMKDPTAFHEALTLPFTGDASVEEYFQRIERITSTAVSSVTVPTLCLLAKDDPLCPPMAWVGALERAAKSDGIVVAITEHGGHCGWFDGLGAGSWLDRATGDFLASALELSQEASARNAAANAEE